MHRYPKPTSLLPEAGLFATTCTSVGTTYYSCSCAAFQISDIRFAQFEEIGFFGEKSEDVSYRDRVRMFVGTTPHLWTVTMPGYFPQEPVQTFVDEIASLGYQNCGTAWSSDEFYITLYGLYTCPPS